MKLYRVIDLGNTIDEEFDTEEEALNFAEAECLSIYRSDAFSDGEWSDCVEDVGIYKLTHRAKFSKTSEDDDNCGDYGMEEV